MIKIDYSVGFHQIFPKFNNNERNINYNLKCAIKIQIQKITVDNLNTRYSMYSYQIEWVWNDGNYGICVIVSFIS